MYIKALEKDITLHHAATRCNTLQHAATRCNTLQHAATRCSTLQHPATHCNTLQHTATHCNTQVRTQCIKALEKDFFEISVPERLALVQVLDAMGSQGHWLLGIHILS